MPEIAALGIACICILHNFLLLLKVNNNVWFENSIALMKRLLATHICIYRNVKKQWILCRLVDKQKQYNIKNKTKKTKQNKTCRLFISNILCLCVDTTFFHRSLLFFRQITFTFHTYIQSRSHSAALNNQLGQLFQLVRLFYFSYSRSVVLCV